MGFLLGAFGKQMAGTRYRSLQARMMHISSRVRRVHREMEHMQKAIESEKKAALNAAKYEAQSATTLAGQNLMSIMQNTLGTLTGNQDINNSNEVKLANVNFQQAQAQAQTQLAAKEMYIENYYEQMKNAEVEPLKDEEEELTSEKEMLEGQIQIAKQDYEACQKMEQADAKMLAPNYTGGQG
jgi:multidrug resistance efflux pump